MLPCVGKKGIKFTGGYLSEFSSGFAMFNPIPTRLFGGLLTKGGGAHCVPVPLAKTLLPFSESIHLKFFSESLSKNEYLDKTLVSMKSVISVLRWFIGFRILSGNPCSKIKNHVPLVESQEKKPFPERL